MTKPFPPLSREFFGRCRCVQGSAEVRVVTYHGTQGSTARGGAVTLTSRTDGSAHEVHDSKEGFVLAPDETILCHVRGANTGNYGVEDATLATWTRKIWLLHRRTLHWSAHQVAHALLRHDLPCHFIDLPESDKAGGIAGLRGYTYHVILSLSSWCESTHVDPAPKAGISTSTFPHKRFTRWVRFYYDHPKIHRSPTRKELKN
jgi:hypothetical protein